MSQTITVINTHLVKMRDFQRIYEEAAALDRLFGRDLIMESDDNRYLEKMLRFMDNDNNWEINDYNNFVLSRDKSRHPGYLTKYTPDDYRDAGVSTYKLKGYDIGYALKPMDNGDVDIISVFNNEPGVHGVAQKMLDKAKQNGGTTLDHFDSKLSDIYQKAGFDEYERYEWDDQYKPDDWDDRDGRPDVVMRRFTPMQLREFEERFWRLYESIDR